MRRRNYLLLISAAMLAFTGGCGKHDNTVNSASTETGGQVETEPAFNLDGAAFLFIIDTSGSMGRYDPHKFAIEIPRAAVSTAGDGDNIGIVQFNNYADEVNPLEAVRNKDDRRRLDNSIKRLGRVRRGTSDFVAALKKARGMLEKMDAPPETAVLFLTDGNPDDGLELEILREIDTYMHRKWRIYTIGLSKRTHTPIMEQISDRTGGVYYLAEDADKVMAAYLDIAQRIQNYWYYEGVSPNAVPVSAGARRLVYIAVKRELAGHIAGLTLDDNPYTPPEDSVYTYPDPPTGRNIFETINISSPQPGVYGPVTEGKIDVFRILIEPPFRIKLRPGLPPDELYQYDPVQVETVVSAPDMQTLQYFTQNATVTAEVRREKTGGCLIDPFPLEQGTIDPESLSLIYNGRRQFSPLNITTEETFEVKITARVKAGTGGEWVRTFSRKIIYRPTERRRVFTMSPKRREISPVWQDSEPINTSYTLTRERGTHAYYEISVQGPDSVKVEPVSGDLSVDSSVDITVNLSPSKLTPGETKVRLLVTGSTEAGEAPEEEARLYLPVYRLEAPKKVDIFALQHAFTPQDGQKAFRPENDIKTEPVPIRLITPAQVKIEVKPGPDSKDPTALLGLQVQPTKDGFVFTGRVPQMVPAGDYSGQLVVKTFIPGLEERRVPYVLKVEIPAADLNIQEKGAVSISGDTMNLTLTSTVPNKWVDAEIDMTPAFVYGAKLECELLELRDSNNVPKLKARGIRQQRSIRLKGTVNGEKLVLEESKDAAGSPKLTAALVEGAPHVLIYSVHVSSDLEAGDYVGGLILRMVRNGETVYEKKIRVILQVIRN